MKIYTLNKVMDLRYKHVVEDVESGDGSGGAVAEKETGDDEGGKEDDAEKETGAGEGGKEDDGEKESGGGEGGKDDDAGDAGE